VVNSAYNCRFSLSDPKLAQIILSTKKSTLLDFSNNAVPANNQQTINYSTSFTFPFPNLNDFLV